jgi:hypothetical protein
MGAATRIDVKLSAIVPRTRSRTRAPYEEWTDLDVLGVEYSPLSGLAFTVADCKTLKGRVAERVFWLRGVADLFGARSAFLVRDEEIASAARQLALRLGIAAVDPTDRAALVEQAGEALLPAAGSFLAAEQLQRWMIATTQTPDTAKALQRYRRAYYWTLPRRRNLTQLPAYLQAASRLLRPDQQWCLLLVLDLAWLYLVALLGAVEDVVRLQFADGRGSLAQIVTGSEFEFREKERLAARIKELIAELAPERVDRVSKFPVLPDYFDQLSDLTSRLLRRRDLGVGALRALEFVGVETISGRGVSWTEAFPDRDLVEAKLASDVIRFLAKAAGLDPVFVTHFDELIAPAPSVSAIEGEQAALFETTVGR